MNEENNELTDLLKALVDRVKRLEQTVFNADNVLLKAGLIKVEGLKPSINTMSNDVPNQETLAKMDWAEIDELVVKLSGE
jgi:hypothetical protein